MNLYLRFLYTLIAAFFRTKMPDPFASSSLRFHVLPTDLDLNLHMNNGRYMTLMDLGRMDFLIRTGILQKLWKMGRVPVLGGATIRFRISLSPFQKYDLETRLVCWDAKWMYIEQKFIIRSGRKAGAVAAVATVKGGFFDKKTKFIVPTEQLIVDVGFTGPAPEVPAHVAKWMESEDIVRKMRL